MPGATLLLVEAFAKSYDSSSGPGRVILLTSGQRLGPMPGEYACVASKGAVEAIALTLSDALMDRGITGNVVNPGPTDTGYATDEGRERVRSRFPQRRWGEPDDAARLVRWLLTDDACWITGQVIDSEGGFRRWTPSDDNTPLWD